ncbi:XRE family transcriptional regulator [Streptomyces subrutilus]|uniref:XRE family transcriptional regulator n=1 Tax=Streptomyces subrutilus TaxID=36818 RepID=UPI00340DC47D
MTPLDVPQPEDDPPSLPGAEPEQAVLPPPVPVRPGGGEPARRGRKADPVSEQAGPCHQAWLGPLRGGVSAAGYTLDQLASLTGFSKTRLSTLLRGAENYPGWEITYSVVHVLGLPAWPLRRLWTAGAREADKNQTWIAKHIGEVPFLKPEQPPLAYEVLTATMREPYTDYAGALLQSERAGWIVAETFDLLWFGWDAALRSPDVRRHAWLLLRDRVLRRAHRHRDGRPDLRPAAFHTVAQSLIEDPEARFAEISALAGFFDLLGQLPLDQLDIVVLRYLCGLGTAALPEVVGLPPARVRTLDHHARGALEHLHPRHDDPGVITP